MCCRMKTRLLDLNKTRTVNIQAIVRVRPDGNYVLSHGQAALKTNLAL